MHRAATYVLLCLSLLSAVSCGGRKGSKAAVPAVREFPSVTIPSAITDADARAAYLTDRFWDAFLDTARVYPSAEERLNGVSADELEQQVGNYCFLLQMVPLASARESVIALYEKMEAFQRKDPSAPVFSLMSGLLDRYFYDPNSPVRNEDVFQPLAARLAECPFLPQEQRTRYASVAVTAALNAVGTKAADFRFTDLSGKRRTLYGIRADELLLIFGNPDCTACRELMEDLSADPGLADRLRRGTLRVVDIYIDEDVEAWKAKAAAYPADWINGYDAEGRIRSDLLYHVRAIPSLYLLDKDKTVIFKDAPKEKIFTYLVNQ